MIDLREYLRTLKDLSEITLNVSESSSDTNERYPTEQNLYDTVKLFENLPELCDSPCRVLTKSLLSAFANLPCYSGRVIRYLDLSEDEHQMYKEGQIVRFTGFLQEDLKLNYHERLWRETCCASAETLQDHVSHVFLEDFFRIKAERKEEISKLVHVIKRYCDLKIDPSLFDNPKLFSAFEEKIMASDDLETDEGKARLRSELLLILQTEEIQTINKPSQQPWAPYLQKIEKIRDATFSHQSASSKEGQINSQSLIPLLLALQNENDRVQEQLSALELALQSSEKSENLLRKGLKCSPAWEYLKPLLEKEESRFPVRTIMKKPKSSKKPRFKSKFWHKHGKVNDLRLKGRPSSPQSRKESFLNSNGKREIVFEEERANLNAQNEPILGEMKNNLLEQISPKLGNEDDLNCYANLLSQEIPSFKSGEIIGKNLLV